MPDEIGVVEDTITGLCCSDYNTVLANCQWDAEDNAVEFPSLTNAESTAADMNLQAGAVGRFIGRRPKPH